MTRMALILAALAAPAAAQQQSVCAPRDGMVAFLAERYGETAQGLGLSVEGAVVEVYASERTGTFTVLLTAPNGTSCIAAAGHGWSPGRQIRGEQA